MILPTEVFGDVVVVHAPEELGGDHVEEFEEFVRGLDPHRVVLDIDNSEAIDSAGLTSMLNVQDALREQNGDLKISTDNEINRKILEITRLDQQLEVFSSVVEAVRSFR